MTQHSALFLESNPKSLPHYSLTGPSAFMWKIVKVPFTNHYFQASLYAFSSGDSAT